MATGLQLCMLACVLVLMPHYSSAQECELPERWYDPEGVGAATTAWFCGENIVYDVTVEDLISLDDGVDRDCSSGAENGEVLNGVFSVALTEDANDGSFHCTQGYNFARALLFNQVPATAATTAAECVDELADTITGADMVWDLWVVEQTENTGDMYGGDTISEAFALLNQEYLLEVETSDGETCASDCDSTISIVSPTMIVSSCIASVAYEKPGQAFFILEGVFPDDVIVEGGSAYTGSLAIRNGLDFYCARYEWMIENGEQTGVEITIRTDEQDNPHCYGPYAEYLPAESTWIRFTLKSLECCLQEEPCGDMGACVPVFPNSFECACAEGFYPPNCLSADELCGDFGNFGKCLPPGCTKRDSPICQPRECGGCPAKKTKFRQCPPEVPEFETYEQEDCDTSRKCIIGQDKRSEVVKIGVNRKGRKVNHIKQRQCCLLYRFNPPREVAKSRHCSGRRARGWKKP